MDFHWKNKFETAASVGSGLTEASVLKDQLIT